MRHLRFALSMTLAAMAALPLLAQQKKLSPHETVSAVLGDRHAGNRVTITYGRPYTNDPRTGAPRVIWGGLVPWDKAYRLGADEATTFITEHPVMVGDVTVPAGAYTLYMVPSESGSSKLAISTSLGKWGVPVDETHDLGRTELKKEALDAPVGQLTIAIGKDPSGGGTLKIQWEKTQFSVALRAPGAPGRIPPGQPARDAQAAHRGDGHRGGLLPPERQGARDAGRQQPLRRGLAHRGQQCDPDHVQHARDGPGRAS